MVVSDMNHVQLLFEGVLRAPSDAFHDKSFQQFLGGLDLGRESIQGLELSLVALWLFLT